MVMLLYFCWSRYLYWMKKYLFIRKLTWYYYFVSHNWLKWTTETHQWQKHKERINKMWNFLTILPGSWWGSNLPWYWKNTSQVAPQPIVRTDRCQLVPSEIVDIPRVWATGTCVLIIQICQLLSPLFWRLQTSTWQKRRPRNHMFQHYVEYLSNFISVHPNKGQ